MFCFCALSCFFDCGKKLKKHMSVRDEQDTKEKNEKAAKINCPYFLLGKLKISLEETKTANAENGTKNIIEWMQSREVGNELRDKPILYGGLIVFTFLFGLVFFFGSDIAALMINDQYSCNIIGGSNYVSFSEFDYLEGGAITHLALIGVICCIGCCAAMVGEEDDEVLICVMPCLGCGWIFFICWIVIGFLLESEMNESNVVDYQQCSDTLYAWTIIKLIEFGIIPCCGCMVFLIANIWEDGDILEDGCMFGMLWCGGLCVLGFFLGSDIAVLVVHSNYNCDNAVIGAAQYLNATDWILGGGITHIIVMFFAGCCVLVAANGESSAIACGCCTCIFFVVWAIFGIFLYQDMDKEDDANKMCSDAVLSWTIIKLIEFVAIPMCAMYVSVFDN